MHAVNNHHLARKKTTFVAMRTHRSSHQFSAGFTLLELIVTVVIIAILAMMATPSIKSFTERNRVTATTNEFVNTLFYVRSESLKRRMNVAICVRNDAGDACNTTSKDYNKGWLIYMDCDNDGAFDTSNTCDLDGDGTAETPELLRLHKPLKQISLKGTNSFANRILYKPSGRANATGHIKIKIDNTEKKRIIISRTGRIRSCVPGSC